MTKFKEALDIVLRYSEKARLPSEKIKVVDSLGRVLAENIYSKIDLPDTDNSAMDGYAVKSTDCKESGVELEVVGEIKAGTSIEETFRLPIKSGKAVKIFTGAVIPPGMDAVVPVEEAILVSSSRGAKIKILSPVRKGQHIRRRGENFRKGELVLKKGKIIRPQEIGLLIQLGHREIKVARRPRVGVLSTGDELVEPGEKIKPGSGKIFNINSYTLSSAVLSAGAIPVSLGVARDKKSEIKSKIKKGLLESDILLISAGISVGEYDYVKQALFELNVKQKFWKVQQRPGQPLFFGVVYPRGAFPKSHKLLDSPKLVFGLPGNTVSCLVCFNQYVLPSILKIQGAEPSKEITINPVVIAESKQEIKVKPGKRYFLRGIANQKNGKYSVTLAGAQGSGILKGLSDANCLIILDEKTSTIKPKENVIIQLI